MYTYTTWQVHYVPVDKFRLDFYLVYYIFARVYLMRRLMIQSSSWLKSLECAKLKRHCEKDWKPMRTYSEFFHIPRKKFLWLKKIVLNQTNLFIAIRSKKSFFDLKKFLDCFFFFELMEYMSAQSHGTNVMWLTEIFSLL